MAEMERGKNEAMRELLDFIQELADVVSTRGGPFRDSRVVEATQTCSGCPDAYEGRLDDGRSFYLRYRYGVVSLRVGAAADSASRRLGGDLDGVFESDEQRDEVFTALLDEIDDN